MSKITGFVVKNDEKRGFLFSWIDLTITTN
jgi:hypothetical protein